MADLIAPTDAPRDQLADTIPGQRLRQLAQRMRTDFLLDYLKADPQRVGRCQATTGGEFGMRINAIAAGDARGNRNIGFDRMDLGDTLSTFDNPSRRLDVTDPVAWTFRGRGGNAGVARERFAH